MSNSLSVIILAAGLGTRMKSRKAKVLHEAGGKAIAEHVLDAAFELASPEDIYVVIGHQAPQVRERLSGLGVNFVEQTEQKGTGHAVLTCSGSMRTREGRVMVLYGDTPLLTAATLKRLCDQHAASGAGATAITTVVDNPTGYGRIVRNAQGHVDAVVEQKAATPEQLLIREINAGIYCFEAELLWTYLLLIEPNNAAGEYYLTDMVELLNRGRHGVQAMVLEDSSELLGINNRVELAQADRILRNRKVHELMLSGVTIERPETVMIDKDVAIGMDTIIEPFVHITGKTVIGENCHIGSSSIIEGSHLMDGVRIHPFTSISQCAIEQGASIGPYARLRMGCQIAAGGHIGNFVELKNTQFGKGSKSMHLAYLGDSVIGEKVNVGAGTITCNYDGRKKHRTTIGGGSFIGSNSTLVAPVEIGKGAYVGAGSVVTDTVPDDALALGRGRQVIKEGWAKKRRDS